MVALDALTGMTVLCAAVFLTGNNALAVISVLLVALSILVAFETPTVQACIPQMLAGDNISRGNAVVNQVASVSYLTAPMLGGILYAAFRNLLFPFHKTDDYTYRHNNGCNYKHYTVMSCKIDDS